MATYTARTPDGMTTHVYSCVEHGYHVSRSTAAGAALAERLHLNVSHSGATPIVAR